MADRPGFFERMRLAADRRRIDSEVNKRLAIVNKRISDLQVGGEAQDLEQIATTSPGRASRITGLVKDLFKVFNRSLSADTYYDIFYDFERLATVYEREPYVLRAVSFYIENALKTEPKFVGQDDEFVDNIVMRFKEMEVVTRQDFRSLLRNMLLSLILYGNIIITKRRDNKATTGKPYTRFDGSSFDPVAGYFVEDPRLMLVRKDPVTKKLVYVRSFEKVFPKGGTFVTLPGARLFVPYNLHYMYTQESDYQEFFAEDEVIHIRWHNLIGHMWGIPPYQGVLEDLVTLRAIEECAELLVFQYGHPIIHAQVGHEQHAGSKEEIEEMEDRSSRMEGNAMLITTNRVKITNVGQASVTNIQPYLDYFKNRVFAGLCINGDIAGEGAHSNRNSADTMNKNHMALVREYQTHLKMALTEMVRDFKYEAGVKFQEFFTPEHEVDAIFEEIDISSKIALENHYIQQYAQNAITATELRTMLGRKALTEEQKDDLFNTNVTLMNHEEQTQVETQAQIEVGKALPKPVAGGAPRVNKPKTNSAKKPATIASKKQAGAARQTASMGTPSNQSGAKRTVAPKKDDDDNPPEVIDEEIVEYETDDN